MKPTTLILTLAVAFLLGAAALYGQRTTNTIPKPTRPIPWQGTTQRVVMPRMPAGLDVVPRDPTNAPHLSAEAQTPPTPGPMTLSSAVAAETQAAFQRGFGEGAIRASILARRNPDVAPQLVVQMAWAAWGVEQQKGATP